ncbi:helicase-related protein [Gordonia sp. YC-JH1]|uniref:helicase-related protein n=1 Tax=Gordonia sp. YC-JH1 TaxID=2059875 RepID=UPI002D79C8B3|nr:helicase-related protein [Gordonia sp. YC-JH1]
MRFIHDAVTPAQRNQLFDDCLAGRVRVLIGSTERMGTGMNVQRRLVALHHMDVPWRPADLEQREGASSARETRTMRSRSTATPQLEPPTQSCGARWRRRQRSSASTSKG